MSELEQWQTINMWLVDRHAEISNYLDRLDDEIRNKPDGSLRIQRMNFRHTRDYLKYEIQKVINHLRELN